MAIQIFDDALIDFAANQGVIEQGGAYTHGAGSGDKKFQRVFSAADAALTDDGNAVLLADLIHLMHLEQSHGLYGRAGQAALIIADNRSSAFYLDGHAHERIDYGKGIGSCIDTAPGVVRDVGLIGRQLGDQRLVGRSAADLDHARGHFRVVAKSHAAFFDIGAGYVDFDGIDG